MRCDEYYFDLALKEADYAFKLRNVPVGVVIVKDGVVVSKAHNLKNSSNVSVYHAEILAIIRACRKLKRWILDDCVMYVTLEPCEMCMNAIAESRIRDVRYLVSSNYYENLKKNYNLIDDKCFCSNSDLANKYRKNLYDFFDCIRNDVQIIFQKLLISMFKDMFHVKHIFEFYY